MPRLSIPEPKPGWQRAHSKNERGGSRNNTSSPALSTVNLSPKGETNWISSDTVTGVADSLGRLIGDGLAPQTLSKSTQTSDLGLTILEEETLKNDLESTKSSLAETNKLVAELRSLLEKRDSELALCVAELEEAKKSMNAMELQMKEHNLSSLKLQGRVEKLKSKVEDHARDQKRIIDLEEQNTRLRLQLDNQKEHSTTILNLIMSYQTKLNEAEKTISEQSEELRTLRDDRELPRKTMYNNRLSHRNEATPSSPQNGSARKSHSILRRGAEDLHTEQDNMVLSSRAPSVKRLSPPSTTKRSSRQYKNDSSSPANRMRDKNSKRRRYDEDNDVPMHDHHRLPEAHALYESNAIHNMNSFSPPSSQKALRTMHQPSSGTKRRSSPSKLYSEPTDSLAALGADPQEPGSSVSRRSLKLEIETYSDDSDSRDSSYSKSSSDEEEDVIEGYD